MTKQQQIRNWLTIGFQQSTNQNSEAFYYDKRDHEFFSVMWLDYFLQDENGNLTEDAITSYSKQDLETLIDRIKRIENEDDLIIALPGHGISENTNNLTFIEEQINNFLSSNSIDLETVTLWETDGETSVIIKVEEEPKQEIKKPWWKIWK